MTVQDLDDVTDVHELDRAEEIDGAEGDPSPTGRPGWRRRLRLPIETLSPWQWRAVLAGLAVVALAVRLFRQQESYDLFIDEPFYTQVGQSVAQGGMPFAAGVQFFLHPPGFFIVEAGWMRLFGLHPEVFAQVYSIRKLVALFAAATVVLVAVVVTRAVDRRAGLVAGAAYLLNTFVNRDSAIAILEPSTLFWALAGYAVLAYLRPVGTRARWAQLVAAGLLFGYSVLTKEFAVFITIVPMLVALVVRTPLRRVEALLLAALSTVPYLVWVVVVAATGNWSTFVFQISTGFSRTTGATQITGFNKPGAPSFLETIVANIDVLWTAYLILGLGSLALVYLAWKGREPRQKLVACFGLGALPLILYCITLGTNEEQFFMFLLPPALMALVVVVAANFRRLRRGLQVAVVVLVAAVLVSDVVNYAIIHTEPDNGTHQVDLWMARHVPNGTVVAVTNSVQREIFRRYTMVNDDSGSTLNPDVKVLVVFYKQVDQNYAFIDRASLDAQTRSMLPVFETSDRSNGRMVVYANR